MQLSLTWKFPKPHHPLGQIHEAPLCQIGLTCWDQVEKPKPWHMTFWPQESFLPSSWSILSSLCSILLSMYNLFLCSCMSIYFSLCCVLSLSDLANHITTSSPYWSIAFISSLSKGRIFEDWFKIDFLFLTLFIFKVRPLSLPWYNTTRSQL